VGFRIYQGIFPKQWENTKEKKEEICKKELVCFAIACLAMALNCVVAQPTTCTYGYSFVSGLLTSAFRGFFVPVFFFVRPKFVNLI